VWMEVWMEMCGEGGVLELAEVVAGECSDATRRDAAAKEVYWYSCSIVVVLLRYTSFVVV
jgi:hypothetical protein